MAVSVISTYNNQYHSPGFDLVVTGLTGYDTLTIERVDPSGEFRDIAVRGADGVAISGSTFALTDYEAPIGRNLVYRATATSKTATDTFTRTIAAFGSPLNANPYFETDAAVVVDAFGRTTASGWGTADTGQAWATSGGSASDYSTNGAAGLHSLGSVNVSRRTVLGPALADVNVVGSIVVPVLAAGAAIQAGFMGRYIDSSNHYTAEIQLNTDQSVQVRLRKNVSGTITTLVTSANIAGLTHTVGRVFRLRFVLQGSVLLVRVWDSALAEPTVWHADAIDTALTAAGQVGARSSLGVGNTNTLPVSVSYDSLTAATPPANWTVSGGTIVRTTTQAHEGVASGLLTPDGVAASTVARSEMVPVTAGLSHRGSEWVRCAVSRNVSIGINWYDSSNVFISTSSASVAVTANTWTLLECIDNAPAGAEKGQLTAFMTGTPASSDLTSVDEATLQPGLAGGWGSTSTGQVYSTITGPATSFSVASGLGKHTLTTLNTLSAQTLDVKLGNLDAYFEVRTSADAVGGDILGTFYSQYSSLIKHYRWEIQFRADGMVTLKLVRVFGGTDLVLGTASGIFSYAPNTAVKVRCVVDNGKLRMRAWTGVEPSTWNIQATSTAMTTGKVAFGSTLSIGNTNDLPVTVSYDNLTLTGLGKTPVVTGVGTSSPIGVQDGFSRGITNGWGSPDVGANWVVRSGVTADFLTTSGVGRMSMTQRSVSGSFGTDYIIESPLTHTDIDQKVRVRTPLAAAGDVYRHSLMARETSRDNHWQLETNYAPSGEVRIRIIGEAAGATRFSHFDDGILIPGLAHTAGTWYWMRFQAVGNQLRGKVWQDGSTEPLNWHIEYTDNANPSGGYVGVRSFSSAFSTNPTPDIVEWDDYSATLLDVTTAIPADNAGTAWLKSVSQPALSRRINMVDFAERSTPGRILGEFQVLGRANKVVLRDTLGGREGTFSVVTFPMGGVWESDSSWREIQNLLAYGGTLLLQTAGSLLTGEEDLYFELKNVNRSRVGVVGNELIHLHAIDYVEVDRPATIEVSLTLRSWQSVLDQNSSWQDVLDNHSTWLDVLQRSL